MKKNEKISVVVPCYNCEKTIMKTIKSLENQKYGDFEVYFIDDGSTDNTNLVLQNFCEKDARFNYIFKENGGVSSARNLGIELAKGKYIYFLDSDDFIASDLFSKAISIFENKDIDFYFFEWFYYSDYEEKVRERKFKIKPAIYSNEQFLELYLYKKIQPGIWSFIARKSVINEARFNNNYAFGEDHNFLLKIMMEFRNCLTNNIYYDSEMIGIYYVESTSSTIQKKSTVKNLDAINAIEEIYDLTKNEKTKKMLLNFSMRTSVYTFKRAVLTKSLTKEFSGNLFKYYDIQKVRKLSFLKKEDFILKISYVIVYIIIRIIGK